MADRIGIEGSLVTIKVGDGDKVTTELPLPTHKEAIKEVLDLLLGSVLKALTNFPASVTALFTAANILTVRCWSTTK